jgi:hypothetical protein
MHEKVFNELSKKPVPLLLKQRLQKKLLKLLRRNQKSFKIKISIQQLIFSKPGFLTKPHAKHPSLWESKIYKRKGFPQ